MKISLKTQSAAATHAFGKKIGTQLSAGDVVALTGELGAGKTTLVKGIVKGLGLKKDSEVSSPTFTLVNEYQGREKIYHMDWYRMEKMGSEDESLIEECFGSGGVCLVEWAEKAKHLVPSPRLEIRLRHVSPKIRQIEMSSRSARYNWIKKLK